MAKRTKVPETAAPAPAPVQPVPVQPAPAPVPAPAPAPMSNVVAYDWNQAPAGPTGFEHVKADDLGIPFIVILQKGSPEVDKTNPEYATKKIEGAEAGDIINSLTREILYKDSGDETIDFVPCSYLKAYVEWTPRDTGGGFVRQHADATILTSCKRNERGQDVLPHGNVIVTTAYFGGFVLREGQEPMKVLISMTSTQLKKSRYWLNMATSMKAGGRVLPFYSHVYSLSTTIESNEKGSWYGWLIESGSLVTDPDFIKVCAEEAKLITGPAFKEIAAPAADDVPM